MEIVIGKTAGVEFNDRPNSSSKEPMEIRARVLKMRSARRRKNYDSRHGANRRAEQTNADPVNAKVLVLLVPDGHLLPLDIEKGDYQLRLSIHSTKERSLPEKNSASTEKGFSRRA